MLTLPFSAQVRLHFVVRSELRAHSSVGVCGRGGTAQQSAQKAVRCSAPEHTGPCLCILLAVCSARERVCFVRAPPASVSALRAGL